GHAILEASEPHGEHGLGVQRVVHARGYAVVAHLRIPAERDQLRPSARPEGGWPIQVEPGEAIPYESVDARAQPPVQADVEAVVVEQLGALCDVVVPRAVDAAGRVRERDEAQDLQRLGGEAGARDDVPGELWATSR